ncbi:MAG: 2-oxo-4-hydroxy-4-carboxy-5-ureidoimidazoline decarboxylase [Methylobacteriaceae bacterium]|nr:2-oxo-4-hydroxy-4-carboxy-5-ureidoimidazoline decarboxylase [Methylobacteriaceae bacterium]
MKPHALSRDEFVARFGGVFERSKWIAERVFDRGLTRQSDTAEGLHAAFVKVLRAASPEAKLALVRAHPDLAGRLARAAQLTSDSTEEQAAAGLDRLTEAEFTRFAELNEAYREKFGFPFVMAVKNRRKAEILAAFEQRLRHDPQTELATALAEIETIAFLRLASLLP